MAVENIQWQPFKWRHELPRIYRIFSEYLSAIVQYRRLERCVTVFGSARIHPQDTYYQWGQTLGRQLAELDISVITGGGPGIMEAANRGAYETKGHSVGCAIDIAHEQRNNVYMNACKTFNYFFMRKIMLTRFSFAFIALPGGLGTLDELFEVLTLIKTGRLKSFPVVLLGRKFWQPLLNYLDDLVDEGMVDKHELSAIYVADSTDQVIAYIKKIRKGLVSHAA